jgi:3-oxoacyl-[acyl-carrier protein] reductase
MKTSPVVLITGAAGGLGQALVTEFASAGWRVAAGYHRALPAAAPPEVWAVPLDVTNPRSVEQGTAHLMERWGRIDALINNAGVSADALIGRMSEEDWDRVLAVDLKGAFLCAQAVLPPMLKQRAGHIINIGSHSGRAGQRGQANYAAAKAGLIGLASSLARETGPHNVRINTVLPGVIRTPMTASLEPNQLATFAAANVLGRLNSLPEVARFVVFLAAMENVSGQVFQLDSRIAPSL